MSIKFHVGKKRKTLNINFREFDKRRNLVKKVMKKSKISEIFFNVKCL